jgi:uncharacterized cupin superfamily protein
METETGAFALHGGDGGFEPFEEGGQVKWLRRDGDGGRSYQTGIWVAAPEDDPDGFDHVFPHDETLYLIRGAMRLEVEDGPTIELRAGDAASFNRGTRVHWTILEPVEEFFFYS